MVEENSLNPMQDYPFGADFGDIVGDDARLTLPDRVRMFYKLVPEAMVESIPGQGIDFS